MKILYHEKAVDELCELDEEVKKKFTNLLEYLKNGHTLSRNKFKSIGKTSLFELRVKHDSQIYRGLGRFASNSFLVLLFFNKKSQKLPRKIILKIEQRYKQLNIK